MPQSIIQIVLFLIIIGLVLTFAAPYIPAQLFTLIIAVIAIGLVIWLLKLVGWAGGPPVA